MFLGERLHGYARLGLFAMKVEERPAWADDHPLRHCDGPSRAQPGYELAGGRPQ